MPRYGLEKLLRLADAAGGAPPAPGGDLAAQVRRLAVRRRRTRIVGAAAALTVAAAVGAALWQAGMVDRRPPARAVAVGSTKHAEEDHLLRLRQEVARLRAEADARMRVVRAVESRQDLARRLAQLKSGATGSDPIDGIREQTDQAARTMVQHAARTAGQSESAAAAGRFREVIELFPQSPWADVAREKLSQMQSRSPGPS